MEENTKKIDIAIALVFIVAAGVLVAAFISRKTAETAAPQSADQPAAVAQAKTEEAPDLIKGMKELKLAENFESWTPEAKLDSAKTRQATLAVKGDPEKAYLRVKASSAGKALTQWDSFYFKLNDLGGHLFRPKSLTTSTAGSTELLFDLNDLPYLASVPYDESRTPDGADELALLKDGKHPLVTMFISSMNSSMIDEASIFYACPKDRECSVEIAK